MTIEEVKDKVADNRGYYDWDILVNKFLNNEVRKEIFIKFENEAILLYAEQYKTK